jgi:hypothetical protein
MAIKPRRTEAVDESLIFVEVFCSVIEDGTERA